MKNCRISITENGSGTSRKLEADFTEEEVALLEDYLANVERLLESRIVRDGTGGTLRFKFNQESGPSFDVSLPEEDHILALLHRLRRFILHDERSSYNRVTGIVGKRFNDPAIRSMIKAYRAIYDGRQFQSTILIEVQGTVLNSEKMLMDWLNAFEFHNDETKRREIELLHGMMPFAASRAIFLMLLVEKVKAIVNVGRFIGLLLGRIETMEARGLAPASGNVGAPDPAK